MVAPSQPKNLFPLSGTFPTCLSSHPHFSSFFFFFSCNHRSLYKRDWTSEGHLYRSLWGITVSLGPFNLGSLLSPFWNLGGDSVTTFTEKAAEATLSDSEAESSKTNVAPCWLSGSGQACRWDQLPRCEAAQALRVCVCVCVCVPGPTDMWGRLQVAPASSLELLGGTGTKWLTQGQMTSWDVNPQGSLMPGLWD